MVKKFNLIVSVLFILSGIAYGTILLDNFDDGVDPNLLGITDTGNNMTLSYDTSAVTAFGHQGASRRIDYDASGGFAQYICRHSNAPGFDVSNMDYIGFYVRGASGGEVFRVKAESDGAASAELPVTDYLAAGVATSWQKVIIPFAATDGMDTTKFTLFSIVVQSTDSPNNGTIYIDDIFLSNGNGYIMVDNFNDTSDPNALRENVGSGSAGGTTVLLVSYYDASPGNIYEGNGSYYGHYNVDLSFQWAFFQFNLNNLDITHSSHLTFYAKGENGGETPNISLRTDEGVGNRSVLNMSSLTALTTSFQKYDIPISSFNILGGPGFADTSTLDQLQFTSENNPVSSGSNDTIYLDLIIFDDRVAPATPTSFQGNSVTITSGYIFRQNNTLSALAGSDATDSTLESITFEYSDDVGQSWKTIKRIYDISSTSYSCTWNTSSNAELDTYQVRVVAEDSKGNTSSVSVSPIKIDPTPPSLLFAYTKNSTQIDLIFSEDLDSTTVSASDFKINDTLSISSVSETNGVVTITMTSALPSQTITILLIGEVGDIAGNTVATSTVLTVPALLFAYTITFERIDLVFSEDLDSTTVSASDFKIGDTLSISSVSEANGVVTIIMTDTLPSKIITVQLIGEVANNAGNTFATSLVITTSDSLLAITQTASPYSGLTVISTSDFQTKAVIPPGALLETAVITVLEDTTVSNAVAYKLTAVGSVSNKNIVEFYVPVEIILHYNDLSPADGVVDRLTVPMNEAENRLDIYYYNNVDWAFMDGTVNTSNQTVTATTDHFSLFAIRDNSTGSSTGFSFPTDFANPEPNPFSPNGDGIYDRIHFHFDNPLNEEVTLQIRDLAGRMIDEISSIGATEISWDGNDRNARKAPAGLYIYHIKTSSGFHRVDTLTLVR